MYHGTKVVNVLGVHVPLEIIEILYDFGVEERKLITIDESFHEVIGTQALTVSVGGKRK